MLVCLTLSSHRCTLTNSIVLSLTHARTHARTLTFAVSARTRGWNQRWLRHTCFAYVFHFFHFISFGQISKDLHTHGLWTASEVCFWQWKNSISRYLLISGAVWELVLSFGHCGISVLKWTRWALRVVAPQFSSNEWQCSADFPFQNCIQLVRPHRLATVVFQHLYLNVILWALDAWSRSCRGGPEQKRGS